jgi:predicted metal-binding protein
MTLVTTRPVIKPLCTHHHVLMSPAEFGDLAGVTVQAYKCGEAGCTRAYNSSQGYFDLVDGSTMVLQMEQRDCPGCGVPMYLKALEANGTETWRCAQVGCKQSSALAASA